MAFEGSEGEEIGYCVVAHERHTTPARRLMARSDGEFGCEAEGRSELQAYGQAPPEACLRARLEVRRGVGREGEGRGADQYLRLGRGAGGPARSRLDPGQAQAEGKAAREPDPERRGL